MNRHVEDPTAKVKQVFAIALLATILKLSDFCTSLHQIEKLCEGSFVGRRLQISHRGT
jgi:hypothetical protein